MFKKKISCFISALFIGLLAVLIFFFRPLFTEEVFVTAGVTKSDLMNNLYAVKDFYGRELRQERLPFWSDKIGMGMPVFAEAQVGALHPLNFFFFYLFGSATAFNLLTATIYLLAFLNFFAFAKSRSLSFFASIFGALSFTFSGYLVSHLSHSNLLMVAVFIPLEFLLLEGIVKSGAEDTIQDRGEGGNRLNSVIPRVRGGVTGRRGLLPSYFLYLLVKILQFLSGHFELVFYSGLIIGTYFAARLVQAGIERRSLIFTVRKLLAIALVIVFAILISSPQFLPSWELARSSERGGGVDYTNATYFLYPAKALLTFIAPLKFDFPKEVVDLPDGTGEYNVWEYYAYLGILPLIFAFIFLFFSPRRREVKGFLFLSLFTFLLALGRSTPLFWLFWKAVPGMSLFKYPTRFLLFPTMFLSLFAAYGFDVLAFRRFHLRGERENTPQVGGGRQARERTLSFLIIAFTFADLFFANGRINPVADSRAWFKPPEMVSYLRENADLLNFRVQTVGTSALALSDQHNLKVQKYLQNLLPANFNLLYGLPETSGHGGLYIERAEDFVTPPLFFTRDAGGFFFWIDSGGERDFSLSSSRYFLSFLPVKEEGFKLLKEIPIPSGVATSFRIVSAGKVDEVKMEGIYLYDNKNALPRAHLVRNIYSPLKKLKGRWEYNNFFREGFKPGEDVILEGPFLGSGAAVGGCGHSQSRAEIAISEPQKVVVSVFAECSGALVLNDTYYPEWKAFVDRAKAKIYRANYNFRAVFVPEGKHTVEFVYVPKAFYRGVRISASALAVFLVFAFAFVLKRRGGTRNDEF